MTLRLFEFERAALDRFFPEVPRLYREAQAPVHDAYQWLLYHVQHAFRPEHLEMVDELFRLRRPQWATGTRRSAIETLDAMRYPDTSGLGEVTAVSGLDLRTASHYLHFFQHAYPIYTPESVRGLARLGVELPYTKVRDPDAYGLYIEALDELKERVPYWSVPETNVFLTRIMQAALHAYGSTPRP